MQSFKFGLMAGAHGHAVAAPAQAAHRNRITALGDIFDPRYRRALLYKRSEEYSLCARSRGGRDQCARPANRLHHDDVLLLADGLQRRITQRAAQADGRASYPAAGAQTTLMR